MAGGDGESGLGNLRAVILAGGRGRRLAPYTTILPKPLMPIGEQPILELVLRRLRAAGVRDAVLSVGYLGSLIEAYFGNGERCGLPIRYSREQEPLGTAGPIALIDGLEATFLVLNGDLLTDLDFAEMVRFHRASGALVTLGLYRREVRIDLGVIESDAGGRVTAYVEKPRMDYDASMGIYVMEPRVLRHLERGQRLDLPELVQRLLERGERVMGFRHAGRWLDIGRQEDYAEAIELFERDPEAFLGASPDQPGSGSCHGQH